MKLTEFGKWIFAYHWQIMERSFQPGSKDLYYRIVALWAACEGMLGGIIHGFNLPGTGIIISSGAVVCIAFLAFYFPGKGHIIKATILVSVFKMMLSPYSPPTAYVAVFFQGLMGELLFGRWLSYKVSCILLGFLALTESAIQRILVLTLVSGTALWKAVDMFISKLTGVKHLTSFSLYIAVFYVLLHIIAGIWVGMKAAKWVSSIKPAAIPETDAEAPLQPHKRNKHRTKLLVFFILLTALYLQSEFHIGTPLLPPGLPLYILVRSVIILLAWYFIVSPLILALLNKWLRQKQYKWKDEVQAVLMILPSIKDILVNSWLQSKEDKRRLPVFTKLVLQRILY